MYWFSRTRSTGEKTVVISIEEQDTVSNNEGRFMTDAGSRVDKVRALLGGRGKAYANDGVEGTGQ